MTTIKSIATGTIYELPYEVTAEIMGACYVAPTREDMLEGIDANMANENEVAWFARFYAVQESIDSALADANEDTRDEVRDLDGTSDWEDVQRNQCELLGIDYDEITSEVSIEDYAC